MPVSHASEISLTRRPGPAGSAGYPVAVHAAGKGIYEEGDPVGALYRIQFGCVRIYRILADGRRQICAFHYAGETFGFEPDGRHRFSAEAVVASGVKRLPFKPEADASPETLGLALRNIAVAQSHLMILTRQGACERVAAFILDMADRQGGLDRFDLPMSRADIGDHLGLTIETVSRAFSKLKQQGFVRFPTLRTIHIRDRAALEAVAE